MVSIGDLLKVINDQPSMCAWAVIVEGGCELECSPRPLLHLAMTASTEPMDESRRQVKLSFENGVTVLCKSEEILCFMADASRELILSQAQVTCNGCFDLAIGPPVEMDARSHRMPIGIDADAVVFSDSTYFIVGIAATSGIGAWSLINTLLFLCSCCSCDETCYARWIHFVQWCGVVLNLVASG